MMIENQYLHDYLYSYSLFQDVSLTIFVLLR